MANINANPVTDLAAIFKRVLDSFRDPGTGLLPTLLARTSTGTLDAATRQDMRDRGLERFTPDEYESTLRSEIEELLTTEPVAAIASGQELADAADLLAGEDASYAAYSEALENANDALRARARRDVLHAFQARTRRDTLLSLVALEEQMKSRRSYRVVGVQR